MFDSEAIKNIIKMAISDPEESSEWKDIIRSVNGFDVILKAIKDLEEKTNTGYTRIAESMKILNERIKKSEATLSDHHEKIYNGLISTSEQMAVIANAFNLAATAMNADQEQETPSTQEEVHTN